MKDLIEQYVGQRAYVQAGGMLVEVIILDVKQAYGKERYQVSPVSGQGEVWVENLRLRQEAYAQ